MVVSHCYSVIEKMWTKFTNLSIPTKYAPTLSLLLAGVLTVQIFEPFIISSKAFLDVWRSSFICLFAVWTFHRSSLKWDFYKYYLVAMIIKVSPTICDLCLFMAWKLQRKQSLLRLHIRLMGWWEKVILLPDYDMNELSRSLTILKYLNTMRTLLEDETCGALGVDLPWLATSRVCIVYIGVHVDTYDMILID